jgi:hypothetical protein
VVRFFLRRPLPILSFAIHARHVSATSAVIDTMGLLAPKNASNESSVCLKLWMVAGLLVALGAVAE